MDHGGEGQRNERSEVDREGGGEAEGCDEPPELSGGRGKRWGGTEGEGGATRRAGADRHEAGTRLRSWEEIATRRRGREAGRGWTEGVGQEQELRLRRERSHGARRAT